MERMLYDGMNEKEKIAYLEERLLEAKRNNSELQMQRDYYKKMYSEFNEGMIAGMKILTKKDKGE